jgi:hypothetical protein
MSADDDPSSLGTRVSVIAGAMLAVCRLDPRAPLPDWLSPGRAFVSITRTPDELSIICSEELVPPDVPTERGFRLLKVEGPLPFDAVGIIARLASVVAAAGVSLIPVGTFDTDYILIRDNACERAIEALRDAGFEVSAHASGFGR